MWIQFDKLFILNHFKFFLANNLSLIYISLKCSATVVLVGLVDNQQGLEASGREAWVLCEKRDLHRLMGTHRYINDRTTRAVGGEANCRAK